MTVTEVRRMLWLLGLAALMFGMVAAISFLEAPLKFQAPNITIPLGLGIGRLVFAALNIAEMVLIIAQLLVALLPFKQRVRSWHLAQLLALAGVYLFKVLVVRPPLNARTDLVLAGAEPGASIWHYIYIACDVFSLALLVALSFSAGKAILRHAKS